MRRAITALTAATFTTITAVAISTPANAADIVTPDGSASFEKTVSLDGGTTWSDPASTTPTIAQAGDDLLWRVRIAPLDPTAEAELEELELCDTLPAPLTLSGPISVTPDGTDISLEVEVESIEYGVGADCAGTTGWSTTWSAGVNSVRVIYEDMELEPDGAQEATVTLPATLPTDIAPGDYSNTASASIDDGAITAETNASVVRIPAPPAPPTLPPAPPADPGAQEQLSSTGADLTPIWPAIPLLSIGMILLLLRRRRNTISER